MPEPNNCLIGTNGVCRKETSQLLIVDVQSRLTAAMEKSSADDMVRHIGILCRSAGILEIPVLYTEQYPKGLGPTVPGIIDALPEQARRFEKTGFSCCMAPGLNQVLAENGRKQVILAGQETHVCILQTAVDLLQRGYQVFIAEDAVCSRNESHKSWSLHRMMNQGSIIGNHESVLFEWLQTCSHPSFKMLSALLR